MKREHSSLSRTMWLGTLASLCSTLVLARRGKTETGSWVAPTNAISHWLWGNRAAATDAPSWKYTALGYGIHHASATFWAAIYDRFSRKTLHEKPFVHHAAAATAMTAIAWTVDYQCTPERLQPGYEKRLSSPSLTAVYIGFAAGLALGSYLLSRR